MVLHVVVGAGAAGSMAAVALIEAGCDVLLIESGPARGWAHDPCPCFPADTRAGSGSAKMHACPLSWGDVAYSTTSNCAQQLETVTQPELLRRVVVYPQGRGIGGTLSVNAMIWSAGHRNVFDEQWPVGWGSADMDRLLKEVQRIVLPVTICAGGHVADIMAAMGVDSGPASVWDDETAAVTRRYLSTVDRDGCRANPWRWLESALETSTAGRLCVLGDTTVERVLFTEGAACGLLLRGRDGVEVELALPDALSEVILCAGSIQSPRILMATMNLAGTDCALHRRCLSLPALFGERNTNCGRLAHERLYVSVDTGDEVAERSSCTRTQLGKSALAGLPIGKGLQDHVLLPVVLLNVSNIAAMCFNVFIWILNCLVRVASLQLNYYSLTVPGIAVDSAVNGVHGWASLDGDGSTEHALKLLFMDGREAAAMIDLLLPRLIWLELSFCGGLMRTARYGIAAALEYLLRTKSGSLLLQYCVVVVLVCLVQPKASGSVSQDRYGSVLLDPAYLSCSEDRKMLLRGMAATRRLLRSAPASCSLYVEALPGPLFAYGWVNSVAWLYSSLFATSFFHMCGTCRMPSRDGDRSRCVVDEALRVMGVRRLRIADCSIFPSMPSAPTAATAMAVGRRAGELVTEEVWRHRAEEPKS